MVAIWHFFRNVGNAFNFYITTFYKCILAGDFNAKASEIKMENFLGAYGLPRLIHDKIHPV